MSLVRTGSNYSSSNIDLELERTCFIYKVEAVNQLAEEPTIYFSKKKADYSLFGIGTQWKESSG